MAMSEAFSRGFNVGQVAHRPQPDPLGQALGQGVSGLSQGLGQLLGGRIAEELTRAQKEEKLRQTLLSQGSLPIKQAVKLGLGDETSLPAFSPAGLPKNELWVNVPMVQKAEKAKLEMQSESLKIQNLQRELQRSRTEFAGFRGDVPHVRQQLPGPIQGFGESRPARLDELEGLSRFRDQKLTPYQDFQIKRAQQKEEDVEQRGGLTPLQFKQQQDARARVIAALKNFQGSREQAESIILNPRAAGIPIPAGVQLNPEDPEFLSELERFESLPGQRVVGSLNPLRLLPGFAAPKAPTPRVHPGSASNATPPATPPSGEIIRSFRDKKTGKLVPHRLVNGQWQKVQ